MRQCSHPVATNNKDMLSRIPLQEPPKVSPLRPQSVVGLCLYRLLDRRPDLVYPGPGSSSPPRQQSTPSCAQDHARGPYSLQPRLRRRQTRRIRHRSASCGSANVHLRDVVHFKGRLRPVKQGLPAGSLVETSYTQKPRQEWPDRSFPQSLLRLGPTALVFRVC